MYTKRTLNAHAGLIALVCTSCLLGCKDSRRHQSTDALAVATTSHALTAEATPQEVVLEFLKTAQTVQHIRATGFAEPGKQKAYDDGMAALQAMTNGPQLLSNMQHSANRNHLPAGLTQDAAVTTATESWLSILAHYIDGLQLDDIRQTTGTSSDAKLAQVFIQGENPDEVAAIKALEASPEIKDAKDANGNPVRSGTPEHFALVQEKALQLDPPIVLPLRATFAFVLARLSPEEPWGIVKVRLNATPQPVAIQAPELDHTTLPTS